MEKSKDAAILWAARQRLRWIEKSYPDANQSDFARGMRFAATLLRIDMRSASIRHTKGQQPEKLSGM